MNVMLEDLKKLCDEATPGPWLTPDEVPGSIAKREDKRTGWALANLVCKDLDGYFVLSHRPDAAFIAAARSALPKLIAVAEAAPKGCICHVSSFDGLYGSEHTERCQRYLDALAALEADA